MKCIEIKCQGAGTLPLDAIIEFQGNLKKLSKSSLKKLKNRILQEGFIAPIFIWEHEGDNFILDGHQRLQALLSLRKEGFDIPLIPVDYIQAEGIEDAKRKLLSITSQYGEFDLDELHSWLSNFDEEIRETFRFVDDELKIAFDEEPDDTDGDDEVNEQVEPVTKLGDLWELGKHRVLCGDSTDKETVERLMDGKKADMVFTDPPYGIDIVANSPRLQENKKLGSINRSVMAKVGKYKPVANDDTTDVARECILLFKGTPMIIWGGNYFTDFLLPSRGWIVWDKKNGNTTFADCEIAYTTFDKSIRLYSFLWSGMRREGDRASEGVLRYHPTQKPVGLMMKIIEDWAVGFEIVCDPFLGSGSTLIACEKTNRICYGMEIDPHYCDVIVSRYITWCEANGKIPEVKLNGEPWEADNG